MTDTSRAGRAVNAPARHAAPLAQVTRFDERRGRPFVESTHLGHVVLVRLAERSTVLGDADVEVFVRSAAKPLQAAACLELVEDLPLTTEQVAVSWASHRGERRHLDAVEGLLAHAGVTAEALTCPPAAAEASPGAVPTRIQHNCSGKHALFAVTGRALGVGRHELLDPAARLQRFVLDALSRRIDVVGVGVDGCGAPAVIADLGSLARAYAGLAASDWGERVRRAGFDAPGIVGGEGRLESALLAAGVVAKVGAEGVYAVGWVDASGEPCGMAVKALDGSLRGAAAAAVTVLEDLGVVPPSTWRPPPPLGGGVPVGEVRASEEMHALAERFAAD